MVGYKVIGADNAHYMDAEDHAQHGVFATYEAAAAVCREIVERSLAWHYKPGMGADELYDYYTSFGDDPFIVALGDATLGNRFSAWTYAKERCRAICGEAPKQPLPQSPQPRGRECP
jgi:hypothetical protein